MESSAQTCSALERREIKKNSLPECIQCIVGAVKVKGEGKDIENISMIDAKSINTQHKSTIPISEWVM